MFTIIINACKKDTSQTPPAGNTSDPNLTPMPASTQRQGNATAGYNYLITGDYVSSGIPLTLFNAVLGNSANVLNRTGDNLTVPYNYNAIVASNGMKVVSPNCLTCHAQLNFDGSGNVIIGLGNTLADYTVDQSVALGTLDNAIQGMYGIPSPQYTAYLPFRTGTLAIGPLIIADKKGVNPANKVTAILASHRDKKSLVWNASTSFTIPAGSVIPTDVPAWWLLKKKNVLYHNGTGKGDFARLIMASCMLTVKDSAEASTIDAHFKDILAYLNSIQAPVFPKSINQNLVAQGKTIFTANCQRCHGTYGNNASYPNYLVNQSYVGTDPLQATNYAYTSDFNSWYNNSWFASGSAAATVQSTNGYIAPPLDGVWATAPYLHNGSVPNLQLLLNSTKRPARWQRSFNAMDYDYTNVGWNYTVSASTSSDVYDNSLPGYGNQGHTFGDFLSDADRTALIEYLKTL